MFTRSRVSQAQAKSGWRRRGNPKAPHKAGQAERRTGLRRQRDVVVLEVIEHDAGEQRRRADDVPHGEVSGNGGGDHRPRQDSGCLPHGCKAADGAALGDRHAVRDGRRDGRVGAVAAGLDEAPEQRHDGDVRGASQRDEGRGAQDGTEHHPRHPAAPA